MQSGFLTKEAFAPAVVESKESKSSQIIRDYAQLYGKAEVFQEYFKEKKDESKEHVFLRQQFQKQFFVLVDSLRQWGLMNGYTNTDFAVIEKFKSDFFKESFSGNQSRGYFKAVKYNLEEIWFFLNDKQTSIAKKKAAVDYLIQQVFIACSPGVHTHLEEILFGLRASVSLVYWLAKLRTRIIRAYSLLHIINHSISPGYEIHVLTGFLRYAFNDGWAPLTLIQDNDDPYSGDTQITDFILTDDFTPYFKNHYSPKAIVDCITKNFSKELRKVQQLNGLEEKNGWFPYSKPFMNCAATLLDTLHLKIRTDLIFDIDEEGIYIRFSPGRFKLAFLQYCKENERFFEKQYWRVEKLKNGCQFFYFDDGVKELNWFLHPKLGNIFPTKPIQHYALMLDSDMKSWKQDDIEKL